jgi:soluble lytic murein transglycosylase
VAAMPHLSPTIRLAAPWMLLLVLAFPGRASADTEIYRFVDRDGVQHFTNVPVDPRYKKLPSRFFNSRRIVSQDTLDRAITLHSRRHRIDPALLRAVIRAESDFNPSAVSRSGAMGLMQLMPHTANRMKVSNPYDPEENISGGARYLRLLLDRFRGNLILALAAYNAGENVVERYRALPPIQETQLYVAKVLSFYRHYRPRSSGQSQTARPLTVAVRSHPSQPALVWPASAR